jgi:glycosyltransferase involved in cell wall biosynthesis
MKKVGINLCWLVPGRVGGSETYVTRLLHGLAERSSDLDYTLLALPQFGDAYPELSNTFKTAYAPARGRAKSWRVAGENTWLAIQCKKRKIDLVHHAGGTMPLFRTSRSIITIHDLQYLYYPEYFSKTKLNWLKLNVPRSAEQARVVLTVSEFTRRTVIERLNIDPSIVWVVPHGISPREGRGDQPIDVRASYDLPERFFLYPAITYPHKNHLILLEAFARVLKTHPEVGLVLTGGRGSMETRIASLVRELGIQNNVKRLGYVPGKDLDAIYGHAVAMTFPSRFEGFGAPILEAMSRGCPVIAADATAIPEVVSDAGCLVSPDNAEEWANGMIDLLDNEDARSRFAKAGLQRALEFTWERAADTQEDAYRHALETSL